MVFVVCIAAFASGCGGGGGGGSAMMEEEEMPPVMECTSPQVGTYPDCMDPGPTDEEKIEKAQDDLGVIVDDARRREGAARTAANAVYAHLDATDAQIDLAINYLLAAQDALADITAANAAVNAATTPEAAGMALAEARTALADLLTAQTGVESIQIALQTPMTPPPGQTVTAFTNNSSLIMELIDNKRVVDTIIGDLTPDSLVISETGTTTDGTSCAAPCALYPADTVTGSTRKPGVRSVQLEISGSPFGSNTRDTLNGPSKLQYGFDMKNADDTVFVNAYTDIAQTKLGDNPATPLYDGDGQDTGKETDHVLNDTDYMLAGIWLTSSGITAFAYGSEPITGSKNFCTVSQNSGMRASSTTTSTCETTTGFGTISSFVEAGDAITATYRGDANGAYLTGGDTSYFQASVELTAEFQNPVNSAATGSIEGKVTSINAGGQTIPGSIELQKVDLADTGIAESFTAGTAGTVAGVPYVGNWKGQFFGLRAKPETDRMTNTAVPPITTETTMYTPDAPGSVAGTFYATKQTESGGDAAFIGAFGANR